MKNKSMKNGDYTLRSGKDQVIANTRQRMEEAQHSNKDAFVKSQQAKTDRMAGKAPDVRAEALQFNSYMCNNGEHAQEFGRELTKGLDKDAFPVK